MNGSRTARNGIVGFYNKQRKAAVIQSKVTKLSYTHFSHFLFMLIMCATLDQQRLILLSAAAFHQLKQTWELQVSDVYRVSYSKRLFIVRDVYRVIYS